MLRKLFEQPYYKNLQNGKHVCTIQDWEYTQEEDPNDDNLLVLYKVDGDVPLYKKYYGKSAIFLIRGLRAQLNMEGETIPDTTKFLENIRKKKIPFKIWLDYVTIEKASGPKVVINTYFQEEYYLKNRTNVVEK